MFKTVTEMEAAINSGNFARIREAIDDMRSMSYRLQPGARTMYDEHPAFDRIVELTGPAHELLTYHECGVGSEDEDQHYPTYLPRAMDLIRQALDVYRALPPW